MIEIYTDLKMLSAAVAQLFAEQAERAVEAHGRFSVALSGGSTPRHAYKLLAQPPFRDQVPWAKVHARLCDEMLARFTRAGIDTDALATRLQEEGAKSFVKSWNELLACIDSKSKQLQH